MWHIETDFFALAVFIGMLVRNKTTRIGKTQQDGVFYFILWISLFTVILDILSAYAMDAASNWWLLQISLTLYYVMVPALPTAWMCYALALIYGENTERFHHGLYFALAPYVVFAVLAVSNPATGWFFTLSQDMSYARGILFYPVVMGYTTVYPIIGIILLHIKRTLIQPPSNMKRMTWFFAVAAVAPWVQITHPGWLILCACYAVVYVLCDMTIESERRGELLHQLEQQNQDLAAATKTKSDFFARVSHDMRTPMNGILGLAELSADENDPAVLHENIEKIHETGLYMLGLINDTLDMQKLEYGNYQLKPEAVSWRLLLNSVISMIQATAKQKGVGFTVELINTDLNQYLMLDPMRLKQIFVNLLSNAIKFTPAGGSVSLIIDRYAHEGSLNHDVFTIKDTGVGISQKFIDEQLFHPFAQESNSFSGSYAGSGLGLSITKSLVERMGGRIEVESTLGKGTTFRVYIDLVHASEEEEAEAEKKHARNVAQVSSLAGRKILLCEDNQLNAEIASKLLEKIGCRVICAVNGKEGLDAYCASKNGEYFAVIMDIRMPVMDGLEAAVKIRQQEREDAALIPIIAMTANDYEEDVEACRMSGMDAHLAKPINVDELYRTLAQFIN